MAQVRLLPSDVIARIAAGEVIERPASVVKELLENSLDAGATHLEVHLKEGGKTQIHVKDNGKGIGRDDLLSLFVRHATSKIATGDDLEKILSLGFRGEALYSIGSVAEVNIKSLSLSATEAWEMDVKGGEKSNIRPAVLASHGTEIRIDELFFNTPARKKFLKSTAAETEAVLQVFLPYTLLYPEKSFLLMNNGRVLLDLKASLVKERFAEALNLDVRYLLTAQGDYPPEDASLRLVVGDMNIQRPRRDLQFLFVNGRPVQSRSIMFHVSDVFRLVMPEKSHPAFAVFLSVPPEDVDVNVHPSKREVRIRQESRLGGFLRTQVETLLMKQGNPKAAADLNPVFTMPEPAFVDEGIPADKIVFGPFEPSALPSVPKKEPTPFFSEFAAQTTLHRQGDLKSRLLQSRFIGTFVSKYHLFEVNESMFVIDQHAAQERILFEKLKAQLNRGAIEIQRLLTPLVLALTPSERLVFDEAEDKLRLFGFDVTVLDKNSIALHAVPVVLKSPEYAVRAILADENPAHVDDDTLARRACRASVMAGDYMATQEALHQLESLLACADPFTCPHGRPVFVELKVSFLDRQFLRS